MREIKFRAWEKDIKSMLEWCDLRPLNMHKFFINNDENYEIMQYIGLKDNDSREVYGGDVYQDKLTAAKYEVVFDSGRFKLRLIGKLDLSVSWTIGCDIFCDKEKSRRLSYSGNIYENPELLK